jgi:hypothetical protein
MLSKAPGAWFPVLFGQPIHRFIPRSDWPDLTTDILKISPEFATLPEVRDPLARPALTIRSGINPKLQGLKRLLKAFGTWALRTTMI